MVRLPLLTGAGALILLLSAAAGLEAQAARPGLSAAARSLVVPGWGQQLQGQRRAWAYGAAEAALWIFWADRRAKGGDFRTAYRDLAWNVARSSSGPRTDGSWDYYETLSRWRRSGAFDRDPALAGIQPEEDPATYNGSMWRLARDLHFAGGTAAPGDPAYQTALAWYERRAYGEAFLWDWTGKEADQTRFSELIDRSDQRFRQATTLLGALVANHLLSAADAFVSTRIPGDTRMRLGPDLMGSTPGLTLFLSWAPPS